MFLLVHYVIFWTNLFVIHSHSFLFLKSKESLNQTNLSFQKATYGSSNTEEYDSQYAVDEHIGTTSIAYHLSDPLWWSADLGRTYMVDTIRFRMIAIGKLVI